MIRSLALLALLLPSHATLARAADVVPLVNPGFEEAPTPDAPIPGWAVVLGATNGAETPASVVDLDGDEVHGGARSLRLAGETATRGWYLARQEFAVRPGGTYTLRAWARAEGVKREGIQFDNCYVGVFFEDRQGTNVGRAYRQPKGAVPEWQQLELVLTAPESARTGRVVVFLSKTGTLRVDDLELEAEGGTPAPELEEVFREDFEKGRKPASAWKKEVGATNGGGGRSSSVELVDGGAERTERCLELSGEEGTRKWYALRRRFDAAPGDLMRLEASVRAEDVRREAIQFENLHLHLFFEDAKGETLGTPHFVHPGTGSYDWKRVSVEGVAPLGTEHVVVGVFLSMSGRVGVDELRLLRETGNAPPYADFVEREKGGIVLHWSTSDPRADGARDYLQRLVDGKADICRRLDLRWKEPIDVFVYADEATGRSLTGRDLDFADPSGRRVHQRWNSTVQHEMVHVIAHNSLQNSGTGLFGEGVAVWLDGRAEAYHHAHARELLEDGELPGIAALLADFGGQANSYPASGSFIGWFLAEHGLDVFKELYPLADPSARAKETLGATLPELEAAWHASLAKFR